MQFFLEPPIDKIENYRMTPKTAVAKLMAKGKEMGIESGKKIPVHYNPQKPQEATLLVGEMGDGNRIKLKGGIINSIMSLPFLGIALFMMWLGRLEKQGKVQRKGRKLVFKVS